MRKRPLLWLVTILAVGIIFAMRWASLGEFTITTAVAALVLTAAVVSLWTWALNRLEEKRRNAEKKLPPSGESPL